MADLELRYEYVRVSKGGVLSWGGSQLWAYSAVLRKCGCGPVAALDAAIYLARYHGGGTRRMSELPTVGPVPLPVYNELLERLRRSYIPIVPPFGTTAAVAALGLNRFLRDEGIPFRAHAAPASGKLWERIEASLRADAPALLAVGQNFPLVWQNKRVNLYLPCPDGSCQAAASTKAHFMAVTGMNEEWLQVSSWGRKYLIDRRELGQYIKEYSNSLVCGLVCITPGS